MGECLMTALSTFEQRCVGRAAHHACRPVTDSPFPVESQVHAEWLTGWLQGEAEWAPVWGSSWPDDIGL